MNTTYYDTKKANRSICHRSSFYSIFDMSSCREYVIQNDLAKTPKSMEFTIVLTNSGQKSLTIFISSCVNNYSIVKQNSYPSGGTRTRNPWVLRLLNTCAIWCAKKTAKNVF